MAVVEPYAPCPCGSGEKFKWCCQKVEGYAERAQKLVENGQVEAALSALDEGLNKAPGNPWLAVRKALLLARREEYEAARDLLAEVVRKRPTHYGAQGFLIRLVLQTEGGPAGAGCLQQALAALKPEQRVGLTDAAELVGSILVESGHVPGGLAHLELADALTPDGEESTPAQSLKMVESNPGYSPWLRNPYELAPPPEEVDDARLKRFDDALTWADRGLWSSAAAAFDTLAAEHTPEADRNLGLCRLFLGDDPGAVEALRRYTGWVGANPDTVDLEALCQLLTPPDEGQQVELVQWIWPVRDRDALLKALQADPKVHEDGPTSLDPDDEESPEVDGYLLLDRTMPAKGRIDGPEAIPRIDGRLLVGTEIVALEAFDDGRLDALADRVRGLAPGSIPPAHPRTKVVGETTRSSLALRTEWLMPDWLEPAEARRLSARERNRVLTEVWPETPLPYLGGRTPRQAAREGNAELPLRAALCQLEMTHESSRDGVDFAAIRRELGVPPEPEIDPTDVEIDEIHLGRLPRLDASKLTDQRLIAYFNRAHRYVIPQAVERAARVLVERPHLLDKEGGPSRFTVFADLANLAITRGDVAEAFDWIRKGREGEPPATRAANATRWDMLEVRHRAKVEEPEKWVPELAAVLDRYRESEAAGTAIIPGLVEMGLLRMMPNPDRPGDFLLDSRPLQAVISRFGPKITTASGQLGVSATRGGIWTPGSETAAPGGLWTPGQGAQAPDSGDKPKLIIPGR